MLLRLVPSACAAMLALVSYLLLFCCKKHWSAHMVTADYLQVVTGPISASVAFLLEVAMALMTCAELLRIGGHLSANLTMDTCSWCSVDIAGQCQVLS